MFQYVEKKEDNKVQICGSDVELRALEGEEEELFLEKTRQDIEKRREQNSRFKKGRRGKRK